MNATKYMNRDRQAKRLLLLPFFAIMLLFSGAAQAEDEVAHFRVKEIKGDITLGSFYETDEGRFGGGAKFKRSQWVLEERVNLRTQSYIYHPNLLKLDVGAGFLLPQGHTETEDRDMRLEGAYLTGNIRLSVLEKKPYPLRLFYDRSRNTVSWTLAERLLMSENRYGLDFSASKEVLPFALSVSGYRQQRTGNGLTQVIDESTDSFNIGLDDLLPYSGATSLSYGVDRIESENGNPAFALVKTETLSHSLGLNNNYRFGAKESVLVLNRINYLTQSGTVDRQDFRLYPSIQWRAGDSLSLYSNYGLFVGHIRDTDTTSQNAAVGLNHRLYESLLTAFDVHGSRNSVTGAEDTSYGAGGSANYKKKIPTGSVTLNYSALYDITDRSSKADSVPVIGEEHVLSGLSPVELDNDFVSASSVTVFNASRSQTYVEGTDYTLSVIGSTTRIQRLIGGSITDGEKVLVDYSYTTSGTYEFSRLAQSYGVSVNMLYYLTLSASYRDDSYTVLSGTALRTLNPSHGTLYGIALNVPVRKITLSADAQREDHEEEITPFERTAYTASVHSPITEYASVLLSGRRTIVDNLNSPEGVDLWGGSVRLDGRPGDRLRLSVETGYEKDDGQSIAFRNLFNNLLAEFRVRRITLKGKLGYGRQTQGEVERDVFATMLEFKREF